MTPPLPDASKKSPRVYRNLQTKDLENVTFSDMKTTGDPLSIELQNEDELVRLVLVQLARLTVKSEWTGLLTAAGGMTSFDLSADSGTTETVTNGSDLKILGGTGISTTVSAPDTITITNTSSAPTQQFSLEADSGATQTVPTDGTGTLSIDGGTGISTATGGANDQVVITNDGVTSLVAGSNITLSGSTGSVTVSASGGGGGASLPKMVAKGFSSTYQNIMVTGVPPLVRSVTSSSSQGFTNTGRVLYIPYVTDGHDYTYGKVSVSNTVSGTGSTNFGIFTSDSDGMPDTLVANSSVSISQNSGVQTASFSSNISLSNSTLFYLAIAITDSVTLRAHASGGGFPNNAMQNLSTFNQPFILGTTTSGAIPSSVSAGSLFTSYGLTPMIMMELA
tara:strand:- start:2103 stop:3281 length:1179 start_codon:yes stop_codon:yes gene_type:complete